MTVKIGFCKECQKARLPTREEARNHLAAMLRHKKYLNIKLLKGTHALGVYKCPAGHGWHVGRDHKVLSIDFSRGRTVNLGVKSNKKAKNHDS